MSKSLISVIVPAYNVELYIQECLISILTQTHQAIEVIVIDDGSSDRTGKICERIALDDQRVKVIHQKNHGISVARNRGIELASAQYLAFVDGDDKIAPRFIEYLFRCLSDTKSDIAVCGYTEVYPDHQINILPPTTTISGEDAAVQLFTKQENLDIVVWNKLYKKDIFIKHDILFPQGKIHEDNLTTYKTYLAAQQVAFLDEPLYYYRKRANSIMASGRVLHRLKAKEYSAEQAITYVSNLSSQKLIDAANIALLLAKIAYLDAASRHEITHEHDHTIIKWVKQHASDYKNNQFMSKKLKLYITLITKTNGGLYRTFRAIKH